MTLCRYTDLFIIIIVVLKIFFTPGSKDPRGLLLILLLLFFLYHKLPCHFSDFLVPSTIIALLGVFCLYQGGCLDQLHMNIQTVSISALSICNLTDW